MGEKTEDRVRKKKLHILLWPTQDGSCVGCSFPGEYREFDGIFKPF